MNATIKAAVLVHDRDRDQGWRDHDRWWDHRR